MRAASTLLVSSRRGFIFGLSPLWLVLLLLCLCSWEARGVTEEIAPVLQYPLYDVGESLEDHGWTVTNRGADVALQSTGATIDVFPYGRVTFLQIDGLNETKQSVRLGDANVLEIRSSDCAFGAFPSGAVQLEATSTYQLSRPVVLSNAYSDAYSSTHIAGLVPNKDPYFDGCTTWINLDYMKQVSSGNEDFDAIHIQDVSGNGFYSKVFSISLLKFQFENDTNSNFRDIKSRIELSNQQYIDRGQQVQSATVLASGSPQTTAQQNLVPLYFPGSGSGGIATTQSLQKTVIARISKSMTAKELTDLCAQLKTDGLATCGITTNSTGLPAGSFIVLFVRSPEGLQQIRTSMYKEMEYLEIDGTVNIVDMSEADKNQHEHQKKRRMLAGSSEQCPSLPWKYVFSYMLEFYRILLVDVIVYNDFCNVLIC